MTELGNELERCDSLFDIWPLDLTRRIVLTVDVVLFYVFNYFSFLFNKFCGVYK